MIRIRELRKQHGITAKKLGEAINAAESTASFYETGKRAPDYDTLCSIADYFNVSVDYLLGREDSQKEKPADDVGEPMSPLDKELYDLLSTLSIEEKEMLLASIKAVKSRREQSASPQQ